MTDAKKFVLVVYDVPVKTRYQNLSSLFRYVGARINLSCWIVPLAAMGQGVIVGRAMQGKKSRKIVIDFNEIRAAGIKIEMVHFDEMDADNILRLAREAFMAQVAERRQALEDGLTELREHLNDLAPGDEKEFAKARSLAYRQVNAARRLADATEEAALGFDLLGDVQELIGGLRLFIKARGELYTALIDDARKIVWPDAQQKLGGVA